MLLELQQIIVKPGQEMLLQDISWQQLENILAEMGENRAARISYSDGWYVQQCLTIGGESSYA